MILFNHVTKFQKRSCVRYLLTHKIYFHKFTESLTKETHTELAALEFHKITLLRLSIQIGRRDFYTL